MQMNNEYKELPVYSCHKIEKEIALTGQLTDHLWETAPVIQLVDVETGNAPEQRTEVRILYSESTLYIAFYCEDDYIWGTYYERDSPVYNEECVEVFINPAGSDHQYYELNVSPKNILFDACILSNRINQRADKDFTGLSGYDPDIETKVHVEGEPDLPGNGKYWSVEYAIPFKELYGAPNPVPLPGDRWRINLYRIDSPEKGKSRYYAWNPTGKIDFHRPWKFGILHFQ